MNNRDSARNMRRGGLAFPEIARSIGISISQAYRLAGDVTPPAPEEDKSTVIKFAPHNGGCSSTSGMVPIRLPRITALHGAYEEKANA